MHYGAVIGSNRELSMSTEIAHGCEVCHRVFVHKDLIIVDTIAWQNKRTFPWYICKECAKKISDALKAKEGKHE